MHVPPKSSMVLATDQNELVMKHTNDPKGAVAFKATASACSNGEDFWHAGGSINCKWSIDGAGGWFVTLTGRVTWSRWIKFKVKIKFNVGWLSQVAFWRINQVSSQLSETLLLPPTPTYTTPLCSVLSV